MTDYHLLIESYAGLVPWATHVTGKVRGPDRSEWNVEQSWTPGHWRRWSALPYDKRPDSPRQFTDHGELIRVAVQRFLGQLPAQEWEPEPVTGRPGDRLILGHGLVPPEDVAADTPRPDGIHQWGCVLAEVPAAKDTSGEETSEPAAE